MPIPRWFKHLWDTASSLSLVEWILTVVSLSGTHVFASALKIYSGLPIVAQILVGVIISLLGVAAILTFWDWYSAVEVEISRERDAIVVRNKREKATFRAQIRILEHLNFPEAIAGPNGYDGYWVKSEKCETTIYTGHEDRLLIGNVRHDSSAPGNPIATLNLYLCERGGIIRPIQRPYFFEDSVDIRVRVEVTISAVPRLRRGKLVRVFWLTRNGVIEGGRGGPRLSRSDPPALPPSLG